MFSMNLLNTIFLFVKTPEILLGIQTVILCIKACLLGFFIHSIVTTKHPHLSWFYLLLAIVGSAIDDIAWIAYLLSTQFSIFDYSISVHITRIAWAFSVILYQSLALFIESFQPKTRMLQSLRYFFIPINASFFICFMYFLFFGAIKPSSFECTMRYHATVYYLAILMAFTLIYAIRTVQKGNLPKILKLQLKTCITYFLIPHIFLNMLQAISSFSPGIATNNPLAASLSALFLCLGLIYSIRKIVGLRFFNVHNHVHDPRNFNFVYDFKTILEDLGNAENIVEIKLLTQQFFNKAFHISNQHITFFLRSDESSTPSKETSLFLSNLTYLSVENFIIQEQNMAILKTTTLLKYNTIYIYDELAYDQFLEPTEQQNRIINFLDSINADIFLPFYQGNTIIAYVIVSKNARKNLYTNIERDEMLVFASYTSKVIHLLQNKNLNELLKQRKDVMDELYAKHQEIMQYKESIRSFLKTNKERGIGIVFYRSKRLIFGNNYAELIIGTTSTSENNEPIIQTLRNMANSIETYKSAQTHIAKNALGHKIVIAGFPHYDHHGVIFTIYYPEVSDIITALIDHIKDPSDWDYLLYLETTQSGKLINDLIPGNGTILLNFKVELLKLALTKKAILLNIPEDDLFQTIELIHTISLRENLHTITLQNYVTNADISIMLFGTNPLFGSTTQQPLLEKLAKDGTLFIKNIHFLDKDSQNNLAQLIRYGFYTVFKSDRKIQSNVRIICSSSENLLSLVQNEQFSAELFAELHSATLLLPPLINLSTQELDVLVDSLNQQAITNQSTAHLLHFSHKERERITDQKPISLLELRQRVQHLLVTKSKKNNIHEETTIDTTYAIADPLLEEAAQLGKYALKDKKILTLLWNTFKNQNKIALFLGVNRSSVHRRCKYYDLIK